MFIGYRLLCLEPCRSACLENGALVDRITNSPLEDLSGEVGIILSVMDALNSNPGSLMSVACIWPRPP